ncbi:MAG: hypothetical protein HYS81_03565 [Candidatus Aenigmatarchaeota archaeon]|nr:MAG: hypothetical protein HYS81_03565 [Candidatus Aenigmarchaeota archaeon]
MPRIILVGEDHTDIRAYRRLTRIFNAFKPHVISVETTPDYYATAMGYLDETSKDGVLEEKQRKLVVEYPDAHPETVRLFLTNMFSNMRAVRDYRRRHRTGMLFCETEETDKIIDQVMAIPDNNPGREFEKLLQQPPRRAFTDAEYTLEAYPVRDAPDLEAFLSERDAFAERLLRRQRNSVVHFGGLDHIYGDYHNLFDRLTDLQPIRMKLNAADRLRI